MKKILGFILSAVAAFATALAFVGCGDNKAVYHVYMPDGAPAIALSALMDMNYDGADFTVVTSDEIAPLVANGTADLAIMPINAAATLYNKGVDIVMLSVNTHGNLYIVGGDTPNLELSDIVGSSLGVIGQGLVPDITLKLLLDELNIEYEVAELNDGAVGRVDGKIALYYGAATTLVPMLKSDKIDYVLLGEPAATGSGKTTAVDIQEQWVMAFESEFPQACLVAKGSIVDNDDEFIQGFIEMLSETEDWAKKNPTAAVAAIASHMKSGTEATLKSLSAGIVERCNISTVMAEDCRTLCEEYFDKLVGLSDRGIQVLDKAPDLDFYYLP